MKPWTAERTARALPFFLIASGRSRSDLARFWSIAPRKSASWIPATFRSLRLGHRFSSSLPGCFPISGFGGRGVCGGFW